MAHQPTPNDPGDIIEICFNPSSADVTESQSAHETFDPATVTKDQVLEKVAQIISHLEHGGRCNEGPTVNGKGIVQWVADAIEMKDKRIEDLENALMRIAEAAEHISELTYLE